MKKYSAFMTGILSLLLVFGMMTVVGCDQPTDKEDPVEYTVTFDANGGTTPESVKVESGKTVSSLPEPTKTGGVYFWGWYTKNGNSGDWGSPFTVLTVVTADITVYARWENSKPIKHKVTFDADGGTVDPKSIEVISGDKPGTLPTPKKSGHTFGGWYTVKNGGGTKFSDTTPVTAALTVYAKWTAAGSGGNGTGIAAKWQGTYMSMGDDDGSITITANSATYKKGDTNEGKDGITTQPGGNVLISGNDVGDWVYLVFEGDNWGVFMYATVGETTVTMIAIGEEGVEDLIEGAEAEQASFSPEEPSISRDTTGDFSFVGIKSED
jgi:uncharacterized repeat protein (TIGR02543 family)